MKITNLSNHGSQTAYDLRPKTTIIPLADKKKANKKGPISDFESLILDEFEAQKYNTEQLEQMPDISRQLVSKAVSSLHAFWV